MDGGELQVLLRPEVGEHAGLADRQVAGQPSDRQTVEPVDRGDVGGVPQDRGPRPLATGDPAVGRGGHARAPRRAISGSRQPSASAGDPSTRATRPASAAAVVEHHGERLGQRGCVRVAPLEHEPARGGHHAALEHPEVPAAAAGGEHPRPHVPAAGVERELVARRARLADLDERFAPPPRVAEQDVVLGEPVDRDVLAETRRSRRRSRRPPTPGSAPRGRRTPPCRARRGLSGRPAGRRRGWCATAPARGRSPAPWRWRCGPVGRAPRR